MNKIKTNLTERRRGGLWWKGYRKLKGSPHDITHPQKLPELVFKSIQGNLDSLFEVADQCGPQRLTLKRSILKRAVH